MLEQPENVRVELSDGSQVACDLAYEGVVDGVHQWRALTTVRLEQIVALRADSIPGKTAIAIGTTDG